MIFQVRNLLSTPLFTGTQTMIHLISIKGQFIFLTIFWNQAKNLLIFITCNENTMWRCRVRVESTAYNQKTWIWEKLEYSWCKAESDFTTEVLKYIKNKQTKKQKTARRLDTFKTRSRNLYSTSKNLRTARLILSNVKDLILSYMSMISVDYLKKGALYDSKGLIK